MGARAKVGPGWASLVAVLTLVLWPAAAPAAVLPALGVDLGSAPTPTRDTANGATEALPAGTAPTSWITPDPHDGTDAALYNTVLSAGSNVAPVGGQVLQIKVKGCAVEDTTAPSQSANGHPVNTVNFETIAHQADGSFKVDQISAYHVLPFCSNGIDTSATATPDTITTFAPVHMCITTGESVDFYDLGGSFPGPSGHAPFYPQGVPFRVLASVTGSTMQSYVAPSQQQFGPGFATADPNPGAGGFGQESDQEVLLQYVLGTGDDAYGLCPGGHANEPSSSSNAVSCVLDASPEPNGPAPPCPGYGPKSSGTGTGTGSGATRPPGAGGSPRPAGRTLLSGAALSGVAANRAVLRFKLTAGRDASFVRGFTVTLPKGMSFSRAARTLTRWVQITRHGRAVSTTLKVVHGVLGVLLGVPTAQVQIRVGWPELVVSPGTAGAVQRRLRKVKLTVVSFSVTGLSTVFPLSLSNRR